MKIEFYATATRGVQEVRIGNVYELQHGHRARRWRYKVVIGDVPPNRIGGSAWKHWVVAHVSEDGLIVGAAQLPNNYLKEHHNLVGHVNGLAGFRFGFGANPYEFSLVV